MKFITATQQIRLCAIALTLFATSFPSMVHAQKPTMKESKSEDCAKCKIAGDKKSGVACADATFLTLKLSGLHCEGCAASVHDSLLKVPGVESATVSAKTQTAIVGVCPKENVASRSLKSAVKKAGYAVIGIEKGKPKVNVKNKSAAGK